MDTVPEFHAEAPQAVESEGLAEGPYVAARPGVEPTTPRTIGVDSTNELPRPTKFSCLQCQVRILGEMLFNCTRFIVISEILLNTLS